MRIATLGLGIAMLASVAGAQTPTTTDSTTTTTTTTTTSTTMQSSAGRMDNGMGGSSGMVQLEVFASDYNFHNCQYFGGTCNNVNQLGGYGARLMVGAPFHSVLSLFSRPAVGVFFNYTGAQTNFEHKTYQYGAQVDARIFGAPVANFLDPFVSLGAGALTNTSSTAPSTAFTDAARYKSGTDFILVPAIGTTFSLGRTGIGLRGDIQDLIVFGHSGRSTAANNFGAQGGISLQF